jgi:hypothetical protein
MRLPRRRGSAPSTRAGREESPASRRDRIAAFFALATAVALGLAFIFVKDTQFLMPGALSSAHGAIENCDACHTKSGKGKLSWIHGLVGGDRIADSKACLTCHRMPETAFNAHGAAENALLKSTMRLTSVAARTPAPTSARAQGTLFPADSVIARGLYCTTCHQEHRGVAFDLKTISSEQCRSCHVVKFDSFDGHHPKFDGYPFRRRSRIVFDHGRHFRTHFPDMAKKSPEKEIPPTCSTCHSNSKSRQVMAVAPFEKTCTGCHLDQIMGNERVSGPKGIAFLTLPGLDLQTLQAKKAVIGEWPSGSEAGLTPFMKMMIGRNARGRALIATVERLTLQDLAAASDDQIKAVTELVWEIKRLFYALIRGNASSMLPKPTSAWEAKLDATILADLTASLARDVVIGAHRQWLPNLGAEMANRPKVDETEQNGWTTTVKGAASEPANIQATATASLAATGSDRNAGAKGASSVRNDMSAAAKPSGGGEAKPASVVASTETTSAIDPPRKKAADQTDDLLHPTAEELRAMKDGVKRASKESVADGPKGKGDGVNATASSAPANAPAARATASAVTASAALPISFASDVDAESWAASGGWYRQDYAILYRPTGHKDKLIYSWLALTAPPSKDGGSSAARAVFDSLTSKDAQGSCTKCHSVDDTGGERRVNFSPASVESKHGRFTNFIHEPHLSVMGERGCLTCHSLRTDGAYLKSYEHGDPQKFAPNFGAVDKELCKTCHTAGKARQDCLTCHKYHVNGVITPMMQTRIPAQ